jgi:hypothetical protein
VADNEQPVPGRRLGLRPPTNKPALKLSRFLTGVVPEHPGQADYLNGVEFGLYSNDRFGVCGPTAIANDRRHVTAKLVGQMAAPSQEDVFDLYRRSGNPGFNPDLPWDHPDQQDNGVVMQEMLDALLRDGIGGVKPLAFARVDVDNDAELRAAIAIFGGLAMGVTLRTVQDQQLAAGVWDYAESPEWGGHAVLAGAYEAAPDGVDIITWGQRVRMTREFIAEQLGEAWVVIWPEHLDDEGFLAGVDLRELSIAYQQITDRLFPAASPPAPGGGACFQVGADVAARAARAAARAGLSLDDWCERHFRQYFRLR